MGHATRSRIGASILTIAFLAGTAYVLFEDVLRHGAPLTTSHILTALALAGAFAAGHFFRGEVRGGHWITAFGCGVISLSATGYIAVASGARNAEVAAAKVRRIEAANAERAHVQAERRTAQAMLDQARADIARECATGQGARCKGRQATASVYEAAVRGHDARLAELGPSLAANAGYAHAGRVFATLPGVSATADEIAAALALLMPFLLVLIAEYGTLVFGEIALRERRVPTTIAGPLPSPVLFCDNDPDPPGARERELQVRSFVQAYVARHGVPPRTRDVMRECGLPKASASRWRRKALAA